MIAYIGAFVASIFCWKYSELVRDKRMKNAIILIALLIPSILAGARNFGVGRDTLLYGQAAYNWTFRYDLLEYLAHFSDSHLFYLIWYIVTYITKSSFGPFFCVEFATEVFVYLALREEKADNRKYHIWIGMLVYYFVFYTYTLSMMRQAVALAMFLYAYAKYLRKNLYKQYFIVCTIAFFIHPSVAIAVCVSFANLVYDKVVTWHFTRKILLYAVSTVAVGILIAKFNDVVGILVNFNESYIYYQTKSATIIGTFSTWILFALLVIWMIIIKVIMGSKTVNRMDVYLSMVGLTIFWVNIISNNAYRISFYFLFTMILSYPAAFTAVRDGENIKFNKAILYVCTFVLLFSLWHIIAVQWRTNDVVPYVSSLLGIE